MAIKKGARRVGRAAATQDGVCGCSEVGISAAIWESKGSPRNRVRESEGMIWGGGGKGTPWEKKFHLVSNLISLADTAVNVFTIFNTCFLPVITSPTHPRFPISQSHSGKNWHHTEFDTYPLCPIGSSWPFCKALKKAVVHETVGTTVLNHKRKGYTVPLLPEATCVKWHHCLLDALLVVLSIRVIRLGNSHEAWLSSGKGEVARVGVGVLLRLWRQLTDAGECHLPPIAIPQHLVSRRATQLKLPS